MPINHQSDRPAYQQIADVLRERIRDGVYAAGSKVPSETELLTEFEVTRQTVRRGLAVLSQEGLTEASRGRGVYVRQAPPVLTMRAARFSRAARHAGKGALAAEAEALGLEWRSEDLGTEIVDATPDVRRALGEDRAAVKRRRMWVGGVPTQLADSYLPASVDEQIGWTAGAQAPGGVYGLLEQHGHEIRRFREELVARQATPEESVALEIPAAAPVVVLVRHAIDQTGRVVEFFDSVASADKHRYVYEFDAPE
ncbi:MAG: GntR family transcriptional regulator [Pseudonocardiales bacterium]|nr:GntR family transcriptional regulator [Pseudonocardiales bacterium]